jgi:hypothetical protein
MELGGKLNYNELAMRAEVLVRILDPHYQRSEVRKRQGWVLNRQISAVNNNRQPLET